MQRKTSPALPSADTPTSPTPQSRDHEHPWIARVTVGFFAGIWKLILYVFILGFVVNLLVSLLTSQNNADPSTWVVSKYVDSLREHLLVAGPLIGLLAVVALGADLTKQKWDKDKKKAEGKETAEKAGVAAVSALAKREGTIALDTYDPTLVREITPSDCGVSSDNFVKDVYLKREDGDADDDVTVRNILRGLATHQAGGEGTIGIHIVGPHNMGKSRLVWEALTHLPDLQDWTLIKWLSSEDRPFPIETMKGKRLIVLLDRLEEYAKSAGPRVSPLNKLQAKFSAAKIPLIVLATSDGTDRKVTEKLAPLLSSLKKIELRRIFSDEAERLEADLKQYNETHPPEERIEIHDWDRATPGSIVVGQATREQYEKLSVGARQVLKILKLFNSAGIGNDPVYVTKARVCPVADALFDIPRLRWRAASDELIREKLVIGDLVRPTQERYVSIPSNDVLNIVNDYPLGEKEIMEREDWPLLYQVFRDTRDAGP